MKKIECEIYTRCCGYFRPQNQFNKGIKEQVKQRKMLKIPSDSEYKERGKEL